MRLRESGSAKVVHVDREEERAFWNWAIIETLRRHRGGHPPSHATGPRGPVVARYDPHERETLPPLPYLFQRPGHAGPAVITAGTVVRSLQRICEKISRADPAFSGLVFTPHDFRRLFATELVNSGLPIHIGAALLDDEVVRHYQAFLRRRRAQRPAGEYQQVTGRKPDDRHQRQTEAQNVGPVPRLSRRSPATRARIAHSATAELLLTMGRSPTVR